MPFYMIEVRTEHGGWLPVNQMGCGHCDREVARGMARGIADRRGYDNVRVVLYERVEPYPMTLAEEAR